MENMFSGFLRKEGKSGGSVKSGYAEECVLFPLFRVMKMESGYRIGC